MTPKPILSILKQGTTGPAHKVSPQAFPQSPDLFCNMVRSTGMGILISLFLGCGAVDKPIAPEDVGIEAKVRQQQREEAEKESAIPSEEDEVIPATDLPEELPSFFPIGVR
jgi:hypothetical protein